LSGGSGEFDLIAALRGRLERAGVAGETEARVLVASGDDAAVTVSGGVAVTSVDLAVDGVHFRRATFPPEAIGRKALGSALSDLAAMGAVPAEAYVQLGLPEDVGEAECLGIADGLGALAAAHGVAVLGGDISRAPALTLAITVVGHVAEAGDVVLRSGARPDDVLCVTGELGGAAAGLLLLDEPALGEGLDAATAEALRARQLAPQPRIEAGLALARAGVHAMIDISDGLGADAGHVATASGVGIRIELERLPIAPGVAQIATAAGLDPLDLAAAAGEDYELLAAVPAKRLDNATDAAAGTGLELSSLGSIERQGNVILMDRNGHERSASGFDQLRR
jgi:thiamine-monophosphate kinase